MKRLIQHLIKTNQSEILSKSLLNCHVKGLHSIMLLDCPGKTIRMYITDKTHQLHSNIDGPDSLSFHPHHCEITLHCIYGSLTNITVKELNEPVDNNTKEYTRWLYASQISDGKMGFTEKGSDYIGLCDVDIIRTGHSMHMKASAIHTVSCDQNTVNAWLVYEGKEWNGYQPFAWSNKDLSKISNEGLYIKPTWYQITSLLETIDII